MTDALVIGVDPGPHTGLCAWRVSQAWTTTARVSAGRVAVVTPAEVQGWVEQKSAHLLPDGDSDPQSEVPRRLMAVERFIHARNPARSRSSAQYVRETQRVIDVLTAWVETENFLKSVDKEVQREFVVPTPLVVANNPWVLRLATANTMKAFWGPRNEMTGESLATIPAELRDHALDAMGHAMYAAVKAGILPDPLGTRCQACGGTNLTPWMNKAVCSQKCARVLVTRARVEGKADVTE